MMEVELGHTSLVSVDGAVSCIGGIREFADSCMGSIFTRDRAYFIVIQ